MSSRRDQLIDILKQGMNDHLPNSVIDSLIYLVNNDTQGGDQMIWVTKDVGGDYSTVKEAMESIENSGSDNRFIIMVAPGIFKEDNPIIAKEYVTLMGAGDNLNTRIESTNDGQPIIIGVSSFFVNNLTFYGAVNECAIHMAVAGNMVCRNIGILECHKGFCLNHADSNLDVFNPAFVAFTITTEAFIDVAAGNLTLYSAKLAGPTRANDIVKISGVNSVATVNNIISFSPNIQTGIRVEDQARVVVLGTSIVRAVDGLVINGGANARFKTVTIFNSQNDGLRIDDIGSNTQVGLVSTTIQDSVNKDLNILSDTSLLFGSGITNLTKVDLVPGAKIYATFVDLFEGDEGVGIIGELHVGTPENATEASIGEGDSYTRGMLVYTWDGSDFVNISTAAASVTGSTFTFPNINDGTAIYVASSLQTITDRIAHFGIKSSVATAADYGSGKILVEFWNGSAWEETNVMETHADPKYIPHSNQIFLQTGNYQIRYDVNLAINGWDKNDPVSYETDLYWVRFRIDGGIDDPPIFEQFKLHSNRFEVNSDGWIEYFGSARPIGVLPWDMGLVEPANSSPLDQDIFISDNVGVGRKENKFANTATDRVGLNAYLPLDLDTSSPIELRWSIITDDNSEGDINWVIRWAYSTDGDSVYTSIATAPTTGPNEKQLNLSEAAPTLGSVQKTYTANLDISNMISRRETGEFGDILWITLQRTVGDTHGGDVSIINLRAFYTKWCEGGHI